MKIECVQVFSDSFHRSRLDTFHLTDHSFSDNGATAIQKAWTATGKPQTIPWCLQGLYL